MVVLGWKKGVRFGVVLAATLSLSAAALASPFEIKVHYRKRVGGKPIEATVPQDGLIATSLSDASYVATTLTFRDDPLSRRQLSHIQHIDVYVRNCSAVRCGNFGDGTATAGDAEAPVNPTPIIDFKKAVPLPDVAQLSGHAAIPVEVQIVARFTAAFLCSEELAMRYEHGKPIEFKSDVEKRGLLRPPKETQLPNPSRSLPDGFVDSVLFKMALHDANGAPAIDSFCDDLHDRIDFVVVDSKEPAGGKHGVHKKRLVDAMVSHLNHGDDTGQAFGARRRDDARPCVYALSVRHLWVIRSWDGLVFEEMPAKREVGTNIDRRATVVVRPNKENPLCGISGPTCDALFGSLKGRVRFSAGRGPSKKESIQVIETDVNDGRLALPVELNGHLGDQVVYGLALPVYDDHVLVVESAPATVEDIGLVTTLPVVTDLSTAANSDVTRLHDVNAQSTIPVSWAVNLGTREAAHVAVTFPWLLGLNTRQYPRLADVIKIFPHVSLILPLRSNSQGRDVRAALGLGLAFFNAFAFSWGATLDSNPEHFLLLGLSVPDLTKIAAFAE